MKDFNPASMMNSRQLIAMLLLLIPVAAFAQTGTIKVKKPVPVDSSQAFRVPQRRPIGWIGAEFYNGIDKFGRIVTPWKRDEERIMLLNGWGVTVSNKHAIPLMGGSAMPFFTFKTGLSTFRTETVKHTLSIPLSMGCDLRLFSVVGLSGEIGGCYFFGGGEPSLAGKFFLESGFGLSFKARPTAMVKSCIPEFRLQYRMIGPHRFIYSQFDLPLIWRKFMVTPPPPTGRSDGF